MYNVKDAARFEPQQNYPLTLQLLLRLCRHFMHLSAHCFGFSN